MTDTSFQRAAALPQPTDRLDLGESGLRVSPFCIGQVRDPAVVVEAFDRGINFFFVSADMHWPLYEDLRRGLAALLARGGSVRDEIVVATVSYPTQPEFGFATYMEALEAIPGLGRLDLLVAGGAYSTDLLTRLTVLEHHKRTGFLGCRALGATFHDRHAARHAIAHGLLDIGFVRYNAGHRGAEAEVFPFIDAAARSRTLLYSFKSTFSFVSPEDFEALGLDSDHWRPEITDHYRFALTRPEIRGLLCSPATLDELSELLSALERGPLDEVEQRYLIELDQLARGEAELDE